MTVMKKSKNKKAKNDDEATKIQETYEGKPHGWIQWKGTDVCMDVFCKCDYSLHIDSWFAYYIKCPKCGTVYQCNPHIELIEIEGDVSFDVLEPELEED